MIGSLAVGHSRLLQQPFSAHMYVMYVVRLSMRLTTVPICLLFSLVPLFNDITCHDMLVINQLNAQNLVLQ